LKEIAASPIGMVRVLREERAPLIASLLSKDRTNGKVWTLAVQILTRPTARALIVTAIPAEVTLTEANVTFLRG
jgi:hypothetical protein